MNNLQLIKEKIASLHILVVDDEELIREGMVGFMEKFFHKIDSAGDGAEALKKFHENGPFDMVLTDIRMPKMDGRELVKRLKELDDGLFIAVMSGSPEDMAQAVGYSNIFLEKPIGMERMIGMLESLIEHKGL